MASVVAVLDGSFDTKVLPPFKKNKASQHNDRIDNSDRYEDIRESYTLNPRSQSKNKDCWKEILDKSDCNQTVGDDLEFRVSEYSLQIGKIIRQNSNLPNHMHRPDKCTTC